MSESVVVQNLTVEVARRQLLENVRFQLPEGKVTVLVGGSGAGKSVLLRILAGLTDRDDPVVHWQGEIRHEDGRPMARAGVVFQQFALFDELSPIANVQFAIDHRPRGTEVLQTAQAWLDELRVPRQTPVTALSGGQRQRLAVARTLGAAPDIVLFDEPTSGLDAASSRQVAELIRKMSDSHGQTIVVVTHDYPNLLGIADQVLLLNSEARRLDQIPKDAWSEIPQRMRPVAAPSDAQQSTSPLAQRALRLILEGIDATGRVIVTGIRLPWDALPRWPCPRWAARLTVHYLRLVAGPSAMIYLVAAGMIIGFVTTYFTFRYLPYSLYTKPLLIEDLLSAIGFALHRILTPVLATTLIAARCGAAIAADVGVKRYGGQTDALRTLGIQPRAYLLSPILIAFILGTPFLEWLAFYAAQWMSLIAFAATHPDLGAPFWDIYFHSEIRRTSSWIDSGTLWVLVKNLGCGVGAGTIAYYQGMRPKWSASDVSHGITMTVLWATLWTLVVHFIAALLEFEG